MVIKRILFIFIIVFWINETMAQMLNQDAEGKSSIVWSGGTAGIDVKEGLIKINYYSSTGTEEGFMCGVDLQGKNSSGVGALFSSGDFTPSTEISGLIGWHFSKIQLKKRGKKIQLLNAKKLLLETKYNETFDSLETSFTKSIDKFSKKIKKNGGINTSKEIIKVAKNFDYINAAIHIRELKEQIKELDSNVNTSKIRDIRKSIIELAKEIDSNKFINEYRQIESQKNAIATKLDSLYKKPELYSRKVKPYLRFGMTANEFTYDNGQDSLLFKSRFVDTLDTKGFAELGITIRSRNVFYGFTIGYGGISTFSKLDDSKYKFTTTDTTITDGNLQRSKEFTAYTGKYSKLSRIYINFDLMYLINLNKKGKNYVGLGGYLRSNFYSDTKIIDNNTTLGLNVNFINGKEGKFLGGFYVQSSDIFGQDDENFNKSFSFGIIAKFAFKSLAL